MKAKYRREVWKGEDGYWYVRLKAKNGQTVVTMMQGYTRKGAAIKEFDKIWSVKELQELYNDLKEYARDPRPDTFFVLAAARSMLDKIQALIDRSET